MSKDTLIELSDINKIYYMGENKLQVLFDICLQIYENDSSQLYDSQNGDNYFEFEITILNDTSKMN